MTNAKLGEQGIDGSDLHAGAAAAVSQVRGLDVIAAVGNQERHGGEAIEYLRAGFRAREALLKFLEDEARRQDRLAGFDRPDQRPHLHGRGRRITQKRKRPDAGVDEEAQSRARSAL